MALSNKDRITRMLEHLVEGLGPFVVRELQNALGDDFQRRIEDEIGDRGPGRSFSLRDPANLLKVLERYWRDVFQRTLGRNERSYLNELREARNAWAHGTPFSSEDAERALDTAIRLLRAISAEGQVQELEKLRTDLKRTIYAEQRRTVERRIQQPTLTLEGVSRPGLKPWRQVITPHPDVSSGRYSEAEFAADLAQVHRGGATAEYGDAAEFFRRTFMTKGLRTLLVGALGRLTDQGGDPVIELQTNFGGGKTHSMLALYHVSKDEDPAALTGIDEIMASLGIDALPVINRAVLVGTALSPAEPVQHDGAIANTLWGEMAWQLGGRPAFDIVAASDRDRAAPGSDVLTRLLRQTAPCLILIDEWVAFVRQLYTNPTLPAGSFDANLTFAQSLTEAVKAVPGALLVASLPASQIEIGGEGGELALDRLKNTFARVESSWRPATPEEGFEIVRRRLFEPMQETESFAARDAVIKAFWDSYRESGAAFPSECSEAEYKRRMEAAYPIHPELFERLNNDWGALDRFQKTRGVLRLMATVINVLWEQNHHGLLIMPGFLPLDDMRVEVELTRYLEHRWDAIIATDIDGENAHALTVDRENPSLARFGATRRVARALFLASAPSVAGRNPGIDDRRVKLGTVQPGEAAGSFGDALRRLADVATYLYVDGSRYWFSTQPTVTRLAEERAAALEAEEIEQAIVDRLGQQRRDFAPFAGMHVAPASAADVADDMSLRLVVLGPGGAHTATGESSARGAAQNILESKGSGPRSYRNALLFLAPDKRRLVELSEAVRTWKAWKSIVDEAESLELTPFQKSQSTSKMADWDRTVESRIIETWCWAMAPHQPDPMQPAIEWDINRVGGQDGIARRAANGFKSAEAMLDQLGARRLLQEMDKFDLWEGRDHVSLRKLLTFFASYLYLPRLSGARLLEDAARAAIGQLVPGPFAYAEAFDERSGRYQGLHVTGGQSLPIVLDHTSLLVKAEAAKRQLGMAEPDGEPAGPIDPQVPAGPQPPDLPGPVAPRKKTRFYASVQLNPDRLGRDAGRIAEEVVTHLSLLNGGVVRVTLEIEAQRSEGFDEAVRRVVEENCSTLKFDTSAFEED